ncbi:hypothetical protein EAG_11331 [Camponotus floridanus]|uniref:Uncharacterized protein n=1 Tax=Camponotus floridanus TaxID=104421 RepID=E2A0Y6_CAMFO|nr:hypothetical protein EAG_11331 [Camponotus floridanus]
MALASHDSDFLYEDSRSRHDKTSRLGNQYKEVQNKRWLEDSQFLGNSSISSGAKWKDILFVSLSFPSRGASFARSRIVLNVSSVIGERFVDRSTMIAGREEQDDDVEHDRSVVAPLDLRCANASAHKRGNSGLRPS